MSTGAQEMENSIIEHNPQIKILQDDHIGQEETDSYRQYNLVCAFNIFIELTFANTSWLSMPMLTVDL